MKSKTIFEGYCSLVCILSLPIMVYLLGQVLISSYYVISPKSGLAANFTIESQVTFKLPKFEVPEGCPNLLEQTPEDFYAQKKRMYDTEVLHISHSAKHRIRSLLIYLVILVVVFFLINQPYKFKNCHSLRSLGRAEDARPF